MFCGDAKGECDFVYQIRRIMPSRCAFVRVQTGPGPLSDIVAVCAVTGILTFVMLHVAPKQTPLEVVLP